MIYPQPFFLERLREERSRSDRTGRPFTLALFPLRPFMLPGGENGRALARALEPLACASRRSDLWGYYGTDRLGLILPETGKATARAAILRIAGRVRTLGRAHPAALLLGRNACSLFEYPGDLKQALVRKDPAPTRQQGIQDHPLLDHTCLSRRLQAHGLRARGYLFGKRLLDLAGATAGLAVTALLAIPIALSIKCTSRGPVLFRQERIGRKGRPFTFLKFRTMYHNCDQAPHKEYMARLIEDAAERHEHGGTTYYKLADDPRITPVGRFLRKTSLDELPQFLNVLRGEMSLVGPRPPLDYEVERYEPWQLRRILEAKPGITGLWQVSGRSTRTFTEQVRLDLQYVENQSLWLDLRTLLKTLKVVLATKGAC